jgi:hypothetical protein
MKKRLPSKDKSLPDRETFLNETSANFLEKQGVPLWERAQRLLINQAEEPTDQTIFEMGLRLGWKAALRAALADDLPKDD